MKKLFICLCISLMMLLAFTGCGTVEEGMDNIETMISDATGKNTATENTSSEKNNGVVTDDDGFIEENDNTDDTKKNTNNTTDNTTGSTSNSTTNETIV